MVHIQGLKKTFFVGSKAVDVLRGIDLDIDAGEQVSIVGASGVGKSTFLHILGTLEAPTSGTVEIDGQDVFSLKSGKLADFRNRTIGFVFQFHHLLSEFTALENVMMPALIQRIPEKKAIEMATAGLGEVGLLERLEHKPGELSGGEQQRVALARALVLEPKLLLADEPTGNLDGANGREVEDLLLKLNRYHNTTLIIVTHNLELAGRLRRKLKMKDGLIVEDEQGSGSAPTDVEGGNAMEMT
ncbi:MAG: ABC transporter ATP-binding protein [Deltaproteobacteria bacterium]|nr:ABC transporter ATP-binding protein [Deltaproteobacteria bacterium]